MVIFEAYLCIYRQLGFLELPQVQSSRGNMRKQSVEIDL